MFFSCPICRSNDEGGFFSGDKITCPRCGEYRISDDVAKELTTALKNDKRKIANASGWIRDHQNEVIDLSAVEELLQLPTPSIAEKGIKLLRYLERNTSFLGQILRREVSFLAAASVVNHVELNYIFSYLKENHFVEFDPSFDEICITPAGFAYLEQIKHSNVESQIGFCAMWFDNSMKAIWLDAINPAIQAAGYEPKRIDEHHHNNRIDDEIIALIRRSKFVVADFTGQRGGVYFEAGFALGMNLPVIWTVKKSELASVHFDNRQYNFVTWEEDKLPEFKLNLQYRIEATLGRGTWKPE